jgi:hypothetical protein
MTGHPRLLATARHVLIAALGAATPLALNSFAQATHEGSVRHPKAVETNGRDLSMAAPESVGISSERLKRLDSAMKKLVDDKQVAGLVTLLERHGKVVDFRAELSLQTFSTFPREFSSFRQQGAGDGQRS